MAVFIITLSGLAGLIVSASAYFTGQVGLLGAFFVYSGAGTMTALLGVAYACVPRHISDPDHD